MEVERNHVQLRKKIQACRADIEKNISGQCLEKALEILDRLKGGSLYWVGNLQKVDLDFGLHHTYYIPVNSSPEDPALNQDDNGYSQYPKLTVEEVRTLGEPQNVNIIRELVNATRK